MRIWHYARIRVPETAKVRVERIVRRTGAQLLRSTQDGETIFFALLCRSRRTVANLRKEEQC